MNFDKLYCKSSTGKVKEWEIKTEGPEIVVTFGYSDGKKQETRKIAKGKNIGKSNETSPEKQAELEAQSTWNKKVDEGYVTVLDAIEKVVFLPMLAHKFKERSHNIEYPAFVQPKLNGVRCIATPGIKYVSRKGNDYNTLMHLDLDVIKLTKALGCALDGEVFHPEWNFQEIVRAVKKQRVESERLEYWVYDLVDPSADFKDRQIALQEQFKGTNGYLGKIFLVPTIEVKSEDEVYSYHKTFCESGYEGIIIRNRMGKYELKNRSKNLQKYKTFIDDEFDIIGGFEASGTDAGCVVFQCQTKDEKPFSVRPKGSREQRKEWLKDIDKLIGLKLTVRYQEMSEDGIPIFPVGITVRDYE